MLEKSLGYTASRLQVCLYSGARKVLLSMTSAVAFGTVPPELMCSFRIIFYNLEEEAMFKVLVAERIVR